MNRIEDLTQRHFAWLRLDNAAKIYPSVESALNSAVFRLSLHLTEQVDPDRLQQAAKRVLKRFPGFKVRLRRGFFWYYLEPNPRDPVVQPDVGNPCMRIDPERNHGYLFKIRWYRGRIAVEFFHSITDGTGGMAFLKTLAAEYLALSGHQIPREGDVLDCDEEPDPGEWEDAFLVHFKRDAKVRTSERNAYHVRGYLEKPGTFHVVTGIIELGDLKSMAKKHGASLTEFLVSVYLSALIDLQKTQTRGRRREIKVSVPVNLRRFFPTKTLRNFSLFVKPGVDRNLGEYEFDEIVAQVHHFLRYELTAKKLRAGFSDNVRKEKLPIIRAMPWPIKSAVMSFVYHNFGENLYSGTLSNLGPVTLPTGMAERVDRFDFLLGPSNINMSNCSVVSYGDKVYINFGRTMRQAQVEKGFFTTLVKMGVPVTVEGNRR